MLFGPRIGEAARLAPDSKELPGLWETLQVVLPAVREREAGPNDQVPDGAGHDDLPCIRRRHDPRRQMNRKFGNVSRPTLNLAGMDPRSHFEMEVH